MGIFTISTRDLPDQGHNVSQRLWNLKAPAMSPITCPLLVSSRSLHGPTDSKLPKNSTHLLRLKPGKHRSFEESPDSSKATMFPNDYGILRRPPCLRSHARCWFQVDLFMARLTQISQINHTPSPVETGETSQL